MPRKGKDHDRDRRDDALEATAEAGEQIAGAVGDYAGSGQEATEATNGLTAAVKGQDEAAGGPEAMSTAPLDHDELQEFGYLQEINRLYLHPLGLALAVMQGDNGAELAVLDNRDDPEGVYFVDPPDAEKAQRVADEFAWRSQRRVDKLGYVKQPVR